MKIKLKSDFLDYYDNWFCGSWEKEDYLLDRRSITELSKIDQFKLLKQANLKIPKNGYVNDLLKDETIDKIVVYLNLFKHRGEDKLLCDKKDALKYYPYMHASEYIESPIKEFRKSYRYLCIGNSVFKLYYNAKGGNGWQSNTEFTTVDICLTDYLDNFRGEYYPYLGYFKDYPLIAIDYILDKEYNEVFIDFNTAPQIKGTPIEDCVKSKEVHSKLEKYIEENINLP